MSEKGHELKGSRNSCPLRIRWNRRMYRERNRIERMIGHLKINSAIATRYDKLARSFLDALHIAAILRCVRCATL
jgi:transposase